MVEEINMKQIDSFTFGQAYLSNFYYADIEYMGLVYPTNEHAFQAQKNSDPAYQSLVQQARMPNLAKRYGRQIKLREDWEKVKVDIMRNIVMHKFIQNPDLKKKLIDTDNIQLIEGNKWGDKFWGTVDGVGKNYLGIILMDTRKVLRNTRVYIRKGK